MSELGKRVAVAALGVPAVLGVLYLGGVALTVAVAAIAALGAHELYRLAAARGVRPFEAVGTAGTAGLVAAAGWTGSFAAFAPVGLAILGAVTAVAAVGAVVRRAPGDAPLATVSVTLLGCVWVGLAFSVVPLLHGLPERAGWAEISDPWAGLVIVALPLAATWLGDSGAYFAGTAWGRKKLAPTISPKKSWVGFWAEIAAGAGAGTLWYLVADARLPGLPGSLPLFAVVGGVLGLAAVAGDLVESLLKREAGVKDSGTLFPGHGGVLDRVDALLLTLPLAYVAIALLGGVS